MLDTNSKKVKEKINNLINELFDAEGYDREDLNNAPIEEKLQFIGEVMMEELGFLIKRGQGYQNTFIEWCEGLPSLIDTAYYYCHNSAVELLGDILEETPSERANYSEPEAEKMLSYLIFKQVYKYMKV